MTLNEMFTPERKSRVRRFGQGVIGLCLVTMIFATGSISGYWVRDSVAQKRRLEQRQDHLAEIKRLTDSFSTSIGMCSRDTREAASSVADAARSVEATSEKADKAASAATSAAVQSKAAVQQAKQAAAAVTKIDTLPEPTRQQINRRVDEVNRRVNK